MTNIELTAPVFGGKPGDVVNVTEERARHAETYGDGKRVTQASGESAARVSTGRGKTLNGASAVGRLDETWTIPEDERPDSLPDPEQDGATPQDLDPDAT